MAVEKGVNLEEETIELRESEPDLYCRDSSACKRPILFVHEHTYLRRNPATVTCPNCLCAVETVVKRQSSSSTHLFALLLVPLCLCAVPYCTKTLRDSIHRCPSCRIYLGSYFATAPEDVLAFFTDREDDDPYDDHPSKPL